MTAITKSKQAPGEGGDGRRSAALVPLLVVLLLLGGYLGYRSYGRIAGGPSHAKRGPAEKVVAGGRLPPASTAELKNAQQAALEKAEEWREKVLAAPEEERTRPDGTVMVPAIVIYQDKDVYFPRRMLVPKDKEAEEADAPFWKKEEKKEPVEPAFTE